MTPNFHFTPKKSLWPHNNFSANSFFFLWCAKEAFAEDFSIWPRRAFCAWAASLVWPRQRLLVNKRLFRSLASLSAAAQRVQLQQQQRLSLFPLSPLEHEMDQQMTVIIVSARYFLANLSRWCEKRDRKAHAPPPIPPTPTHGTWWRSHCHLNLGPFRRSVIPTLLLSLAHSTFVLFSCTELRWTDHIVFWNEAVCFPVNKRTLMPKSTAINRSNQLSCKN